jgi:glyoxylase-like metal-dependent hydrolase (beta-lactamase superfamily II)
MIIKKKGKISDDLYVIGSPAAPVYLLDGPAPVIFDGGFTALTLQYETGIKDVLGTRKPAYLFLTHSHFDHVGAVSHFKNIWPKLRIGGSVRCREILLKQNAIQLIKKLSIEGTKNFKRMNVHPLNETPFEPFDFDIIITPDQKIELSDNLTLMAIHTPGHTWDFMSYWIPQKKILIASEAVAIYENDGYIQPEFLVDFDAYRDSLKKIQTFGAKILCAGHHAVFTNNDVMGHICASLEAADTYLTTTEGLLVQEKGDIDRTVFRVKAAEWDNRSWPKQPESAYLLNTRQRVKTIWNRMKKNSKKDICAHHNIPALE